MRRRAASIRGKPRPGTRLKKPCLPADITWHVIGHLQQNKVRAAITHASWIHSIDTPELLDRINRIAAEENAHPTVLLEVNISGEASKWGACADSVENWLAPRLNGPAKISGLMTVAPADASESELHGVFAGLRNLRDGLQTRLGIALPELSMGMSHDFEIAIAEGATIVRVGSAIFGHRTYPEQHQENT
ncbi:MAG: YggS family pyridoxal phosphate-dependent enzyme [Victivallales bacterium]|nr:YggS family pyridoxal phosphate-dependent enzyme [Victivallales bacterium]